MSDITGFTEYLPESKFIFLLVLTCLNELVLTDIGIQTFSEQRGSIKPTSVKPPDCYQFVLAMGKVLSP